MVKKKNHLTNLCVLYRGFYMYFVCVTQQFHPFCFPPILSHTLTKSLEPKILLNHAKDIKI